MIHRYSVPVDDQWHDIKLSGPIVHVGTRTPYAVEFWALRNGHPHVRTFRVFGTGQPFGDGRHAHIGTALTPDGRLVWHLVERLEP